MKQEDVFHRLIKTKLKKSTFVSREPARTGRPVSQLRVVKRNVNWRGWIFA